MIDFSLTNTCGAARIRASLCGSLTQRKFGRRGREVEGTPLLREHPGQNLDRGFESLRLRQQWRRNPGRSRSSGVFVFLAHQPAHQ
ncbi:hypothetical protein CNECB9_2280003 [Cupriavidus necator]|uniref:Uncharacterized protein n=1 Tax=Cupriavidus necator TaxID=106590 RepID=A0A1K0ID16_CUPNE|nr:hypothetical protein CNECB9_2280003 [Cupriavidus necator]